MARKSSEQIAATAAFNARHLRITTTPFADCDALTEEEFSYWLTHHRVRGVERDRLRLLRAHRAGERAATAPGMPAQRPS
jgi:hypothetical protein